jgi:hypothetical protein
MRSSETSLEYQQTTENGTVDNHSYENLRYCFVHRGDHSALECLIGRGQGCLIEARRNLREVATSLRPCSSPSSLSLRTWAVMSIDTSSVTIQEPESFSV